MTLVAILLAAACRQEHADPSMAMQSALAQMRQAIAGYRAEHGHGPATLQELAPKYLRAVPKDPVTNAANWRLETEETVTPSSDFTKAEAPAKSVAIIDVHSTAPGVDAHGKRWSDY